MKASRPTSPSALALPRWKMATLKRADKADKALYEAKHQGRNIILVSSDLQVGA
jgi:hypothetical protein